MRSESLEKTECLEKTCLESKILNKMSKILSAHDVKISYVPGQTNLMLQSVSCEHAYVVWGDLQMCLLGTGFYVSLSKWVEKWNVSYPFMSNEMTSLLRDVARSGLPACLASVSSLEEVLLRLEISYPDV